MHAISIDMYVIYAYIRIQIIVEIQTIIVVPVRVLPVRILLVLVLLVHVLLVRVLLVQSSPVHEIPYAARDRVFHDKQLAYLKGGKS